MNPLCFKLEHGSAGTPSRAPRLLLQDSPPYVSWTPRPCQPFSARFENARCQSTEGPRVQTSLLQPGTMSQTISRHKNMELRMFASSVGSRFVTNAGGGCVATASRHRPKPPDTRTAHLPAGSEIKPTGRRHGSLKYSETSKNRTKGPVAHFTHPPTL